jgi:Rrf2 family transcriptional regulator, cysteine metabolism repressor
MIRFSSRGEYGIRMMMDLARHFGQGPLALSEVARHENLPAPYLEQLAARLRKAGLLISFHGARGGYELARPPVDITVGDVLRVLEGPISPMICATEGDTEQQCERQGFCSANLVWERVRDSVAQALDSLTMQDLVPLKAPLSDQDPFVTLRPIAKPGRRNAATI